jgi:hypothetical protein
VCNVAEHQFVKGPVEGWGGIKDGVMKFADRKIHWKDWLKQVQEEGVGLLSGFRLCLL